MGPRREGYLFGQPVRSGFRRKIWPNNRNFTSWGEHVCSLFDDTSECFLALEYVVWKTDIDELIFGVFSEARPICLCKVCIGKPVSETEGDRLFKRGDYWNMVRVHGDFGCPINIG